MKAVTIVGARPQFIKAATVSRVLRANPLAHEILVHTGQHYDDNMSRVFFEELEIPEPDYNLGIGSGSHGFQTGHMLEAIESILERESPDWVVVYGDTNSTLAGAVAGAKLHIRVAHVEAGLRSFNRRMPEELNRVLTDHAADLLFAPTQQSVENLRREGIHGAAVVCTGDVMYDAAVFYAEKAERGSRVIHELGLTPGGYVLATLHRAENTDDPLRLATLFQTLASMADHTEIVLPLHPRTRAALVAHGLKADSRLRMMDPVGYLDMMALEKNAGVIVTDSGGVQKEAFFHRVPCVTLRNETEWVELVECGWNRLAPPSIGAETISGIILQAASQRDLPHSDIYGDGHAAAQIVEALLQRDDMRRS